MSKGNQLAFDLPHRTAFGREDFLIAPCNADAVAWVDRWPDWPRGGLVVYGPPQSGKTHLATVWQTRAQARSLAPGDLGAAGDVAGPFALLIDDADAWIPEPLFKAFLDLHAVRGGTVMLTAINAPAHWPVALADLSSRLRALTAVAIAPPDPALLAGLLVKHFGDRQIAVTPEVIEYVTARIDRTFASAAKVAAALDAAALRAGRAITIALARAVLAGLGGPAD